MLKFENTAQIGDVIKAYDFNPEMFGEEPAPYILGKVIEKGMTPAGYYAYSIEITEDSGKLSGGRVGDTGYVPFETSFMEYDNRVTVVEAI